LLNPHTSNLAAHVQGVYVQVTVSLHGKA
jgi:hypothetical protein